MMLMATATEGKKSTNSACEYRVSLYTPGVFLLSSIPKTSPSECLSSYDTAHCTLHFVSDKVNILNHF